ncbi:hypothetical protein ZIOFF_054977 [Zingiber officinale]|uniref:MULE transposase domain-containing protein n=1 Tax=Zingiber officinale TaxID=94328 RepID=A0A8J5KE65_ZINOF|nr:hypothetical protein ZIOFF_054977 [Zingiber officinale]
MVLERPIPVSLFWGAKIEYENDSIKHGQSISNATIVIEHKLSYDELVDEICQQIGVDRKHFKLNIILDYEQNGKSRSTLITNDKSLQILFYLAQTVADFWADFYVEMEEILQSSIQREELLPTEHTSMVALLNNFMGSMSHVGSSNGFVELNYVPSLISEPTIQMTIGENINMGPPLPSQDFVELPHVESPMYDTMIPFPLPPEVQLDDEARSSEYSQSSEDSGDILSIPMDDDSPDDGDCDTHLNCDREDAVHIDIWSESKNQIRLGMLFESKSQLRKAVTLWSISQNREFKVVESRINTWVAKCKVASSDIDSNTGPENYRSPCLWCIRAVHKKTHKMWQITRWVNMHNCLGSISGNNNRNLTSAIIASHIIHQIEVNPGYLVKNVQADIKQSLHVDISYKKAWHGRRKAIEIVYGNWESNFAGLPSYIAALEHSNPNTIVNWHHRPSSTENVKVFKYIFWAFGPAIDAFHMCRPVISVDGIHLRGAYKGKMLIAVSKDANNRILPVAYAIVDEETIASWCWFFEQFRYYVAQDRQLCVISDRHHGIIHAMSNLEEWKEPIAYHRFCLRHVRSNFMTKFKNVTLKHYCWAIGSTTQRRKFNRFRRQIRALDPTAWQYLRDIGIRRWSLAYDGNHRWGCLTTNTSESLNNVLRGARLLPIKACIDLSFHRTVQLFQRYKQMHRFPCSHAIAVCRHRGDNAIDLVDEVHTTKTYMTQYSGKFYPIHHKDYWTNPGWEIQADYSRLINHGRGRRRESRIQNEMDLRHPDEPRRCGRCHQTGHNRRNCQNTHPRVDNEVDS